MAKHNIERSGVTDPLVIKAMQSVPRHRFVSDDLQDVAYGDFPLPIGCGQTISQPSMVALMSEALGVEAGAKVLEIGTGSGYQAAVLAAMGCDVYSTEILPGLATQAKAILDELGYAVTIGTADGYSGWPEHAPYDGIIVTAAPDHVPPALIEQLAPGASLVVPIGASGDVQTLWRFTVDETGEVTAENLASVLFVPLTRSDD
jgi:protein-L-isoaspartate(D-aspartate) O-methyltransferase